MEACLIVTTQPKSILLSCHNDVHLLTLQKNSSEICSCCAQRELHILHWFHFSHPQGKMISVWRSPSNKRTSAPSSHRSMPVGVRSVSSYAQGTTACCSFLTTFPDSGEETGALRNIGKTTNIPAWIWIYVSCHLSVYTPTSRRKKISACRLI